MVSNTAKESSLISIIITCYNHGKYLATAIESVSAQSYQNFEIIVIDDGSTDDTKIIAAEFPNVKYIYQANRGLSAARNAGIEYSSGKYLVFLDADDWLLADALSVNLKCLKQNPDAAFVSGGHVRVNENGEITGNPTLVVEENHFCRLLEFNYILMHGAVMYRRRIFETFRFDTSLRTHEDYDLYLKILRKHPTFHHTKSIAVYRMREDSMSGNLPLMLESVLLVLNRQRSLLRSEEENRCLQKGVDFNKTYYCLELVNKLLFKSGTDRNNKAAQLAVIWKYRKFLYLKYHVLKRLPAMKIKSFIKKNAPRFVLRGLHNTKIYKGYFPPPGRLNLGDLERTTPFGTNFGYERGGPVDRYYIENFLEKNAVSVKGRVLEILDNEYTREFGGSKVTQSEVMHLDDSNPKATIVGDLSNAPQLADDSFDCIILTQTLHLIYSFKEALETCYRILKPGGTLLLTVPGITQIDHYECRDIWFWSFTDKSMKRLLSEVFSAENVDVESYGNVLAATAFLYCIGQPEMKKEQLDFNDSHYQVIISAVAVKPQ